MISGATAAFVEAVRTELGPHAVVTDPAVTAGYSVDWTGRWDSPAPAVLRPDRTEAVTFIVEEARRHGVALVPQGGNTGLVGGSVPHDGEVVLSLRRLGALGPVDVAARQVTAGAGAPLVALQDHARRSGLAFAVDLGARESATVGGMIATNAGGLHVVRHGAMRAQLLGLDAVLGTGETISVNPHGLVKDNTGYDLTGLLCGSEGTLGVVTSARLRLVVPPRHTTTALVGTGSVDAAVAVAAQLAGLPSLQALEVVLGAGIEAVAHHLGARPPLLPVPAAALLVELAAPVDPTPELAAGIDAAAGHIGATAVAADERDRVRLWRWREAVPEAAAALGLVHKADVTLPTASMAQFLATAGPAVERELPGATVLLYGHLADGNIHVNVVGPPGTPAEAGDRAVDLVLALVVDHGGSVSAEHGIGVAKRSWLERQRGHAAVVTMQAIKAALDPDRVLNPAVLV